MRTQRWFQIVGALLLLSLLGGCAWLASPLGPSTPAPIPSAAGSPSAPAPAPIIPTCAYTDLGPVLCGATATGITLIRSAADWAAFAGHSTCATSTAAPVDFSTSMIIVYTGSTRCAGGRGSGGFTSVCVYLDRVELTMSYSYNTSIGAPGYCGACICSNYAVAIQNNTLPVNFTYCEDVYTWSTLDSHTCTTTVY